MTERYTEFAMQAWIEDDWDGRVDLGKFAALVRADEREACAKVCASADKSTHPADLAEKIKARGNT